MIYFGNPADLCVEIEAHEKKKAKLQKASQKITEKAVHEVCLSAYLGLTLR